jgi:6-pyruvoyltetrahydropterin/6-carboxytetrahydropterin synthase
LAGDRRILLTRAVEFSSSLRYWRGDLSEAENRSLYGRKADVHGHNYRLEVSVTGEPDPVTGMVMDLKELQAVLDREIMSRFDHRDLNRDTPFFEKEAPTPENLALRIHRLLAEALPGGMLAGVLLRESADTWVEVLS